MSEPHELPIENGILAQTADGNTHATLVVHVLLDLRAIVVGQVLDELLRRMRQSKLGSLARVVDQAIDELFLGRVLAEVDEEKGEIVPFDGPLKITSQCIRVPVLNGHTATVFINFGKNPTKDELIDRLVNYTSKAAELGLPHAPKHFIQYLTEDDRPQVLKDVDYEGGMGVSIGRLREDSIFDWKFVGLAHNTLRGAAGGALESAEMLKALGYITKK